MDILVRMLWMLTIVNDSQRLGMIKFRNISQFLYCTGAKVRESGRNHWIAECRPNEKKTSYGINIIRWEMGDRTLHKSVIAFNTQ